MDIGESVDEMENPVLLKTPPPPAVIVTPAVPVALAPWNVMELLGPAPLVCITSILPDTGAKMSMLSAAVRVRVPLVEVAPVVPPIFMSDVAPVVENEKLPPTDESARKMLLELLK